MKKVNIIYVLSWVIGTIALCIGLSYFMQRLSATIPKVMIGAGILIIFLGVLIWQLIFLPISRLIAKNTIRNIDSKSFHTDYSFDSTVGMYCIDVERGMVAVATTANPFQLQLINASKLENIRTDDGKSTINFGGTRRVSFCFTIDGVTCKVTTFTSNRTHSLTSSHVLTGISKADLYVEQLNKAKEVAMVKQAAMDMR